MEHLSTENFSTQQLQTMSFIQFAFVAAILQLAVSSPIPFYKRLTPTEAARLAAWTPESKQKMWELSGQFEGDILLRPNQRNGLVNKQFRWPNKEIPYEISSDFSEAEKQFIIQSLETEYSKTCITVRPRREGDVDYVNVVASEAGCFSIVGYAGGPQILNLEKSAGCIWKGTIAHEFLHAAGFWHQHQAPERDDYLFILWNNIIESQKHNFVKYGSDVLTSFGEKYDYDSVMHYGRYAFTSNNLPTMLPKKLTANIGQNEGLSEVDIIKLNKMYDCV